MVSTSVVTAVSHRPLALTSSGLLTAKEVRASTESHLFVDNVRFWSMFAVVAIHCSLVFVEIQRPRLGLMVAVQTPFKFATIAFFLMSGFLAGRGLETVQPLTYLRRRCE